MKLDYDVIVIGSGPAGIAIATELRLRGVYDLVILEREAQPGGVPRHCNQSTFGSLVFKCPMTGPKFTSKILRMSRDAPILTGMTAIAIKPGGRVTVSCNKGIREFSAKKVILATGARETPRHPCLVSGLRPQGVLTTDSLQQFIYLNKQKPCNDPVIIGSEIVSFSALWILKNAGIKAKAMIENRARITAEKPLELVAKLLDVPLYCDAKLVEIGGLERVEYVVIERNGQRERIDCDSVIFTGEFTGENTLVRNSHLEHVAETGSPIVDMAGRCSDQAYYAVGNMLHPADMGDRCYQEARLIGFAVVQDFKAPSAKKSVRLPIHHDDNILFTVPSCLTVNGNQQSFDMNIRVKEEISGVITVKAGNVVLYKAQRHCLPGRKITLKNIKSKLLPAATTEINVTVV